jgi:hypothetical protein
MNRKIIPLIAFGALAYLWFLTKREKAAAQMSVSNTVTGKKIACPSGYAYTVDAYGRASCVPFNSPGWQDNGALEVVQKGENMVYDQNGNLVPLDSVFK